MTRATLLHVLDHTSALGPAEVRELEQLAQAFPYCQTAHLLLAKAAHDQGTMLAGQRLRRAATYAADRTLLRRLIEQVAPAAIEEPPLTVAAEEPTPGPDTAAPVVAEIVHQATPRPAVAPAPFVAEAAVFSAEPAASPTAVVTSFPAAEEPAVEPGPAPAVAPEPVVPVAPEVVPEAELAPADELGQPAPALEEAAATIEIEPATAAVPVEPADAALLLDVEGVEIPAAKPVPVAVSLEDSPVAEATADEDLPAQAPAIRPPAEAGEARFEFGLAEAPAPALPTYELPGLVDEWAASAVTRSLGSLIPIPAVPALAPAEAEAAVLTPAAFTGDETVGYGFGESSRLGFCLQLLHLLTDQAEAAEATAAAQPPAAPLPPAGCFFEPDPLLLDHWATHCPPAPALPSSLDLINNFLRRQPRLTRPAMLPPTAGAQPDLSVRSTRPEADLVSESLARILVRQGKTGRAVEIYEKLMVKQPEKMAYFAAQIQQLQPPA